MSCKLQSYKDDCVLQHIANEDCRLSIHFRQFITAIPQQLEAANWDMSGLLSFKLQVKQMFGNLNNLHVLCREIRLGFFSGQWSKIENENEFILMNCILLLFLLASFGRKHFFKKFETIFFKHLI